MLKNIDFKDKSLPGDSLLVTPIGICLNFFRQKNNFIFVSFNNVQYKLYDNDKLKVMDAAVQAGYANADLFPKRGAEIAYTVNGEKRVIRGETGEGALIRLNGDEASLNSPIKAGDSIEVTPSTAGAPAHLKIDELPEFTESLKVIFNGSEVQIPKYAEVNGALQSGFYEVRDEDEIIMRNYVTVEQLLSFLDVKAEKDSNIMINNVPAESDTKVYENFTVELLIDDSPHDPEEEDPYLMTDDEKAAPIPDEAPESEKAPKADAADTATETEAPDGADAVDTTSGAEAEPEVKTDETAITVTVNDQSVTLSGKNGYVFVDVFDHIDFDLTKPHGKMVVTKKNGMRAEYSEKIKDGDRLDIYWEK